MMKFLLFFTVIILIVTITYSIKIWTSNLQESLVDLDVIKFKNYLVQFNKSYTDKEFSRRLRNFKVSLNEIARLNALEGATVFGLTKFSDMSPEEFSQRMLKGGDICYEKKETCNIFDSTTISKETTINAIPKVNEMDRFDWREHGCNTPIQDQKLCNACWAFTIAGVMECMAIKRNISHDMLSVQEIIDCTRTSNKCAGGSTARTLDELCLFNTHIATEKKYPLTLKTNSNCINITNGIRLNNYVYRCKMDENEMVELIKNHGPLTAVINGVPLQNYVGGIIRRACRRSNDHPIFMYHAIQIVGYDKTLQMGDLKYFILKNSMGEDLGEGGYVRMAMYNNTCGISDEVGYLDVK